MKRRSVPRVCLFAGPSLSVGDVQEAFGRIEAEVTVLPPIEQGDILRLAARPPDVIGIVDGTFFHAPAVLHREILFALERGVRILGAASIGALRAAELDRFGMEGIGAIYRAYRMGILESDDEVAVLHGSAAEGYRPLTEALVSIRHNLRLARRRGVLSLRAAAAALCTARRLHFTGRTRAALLAAVPGDERTAFARFLECEAVDVKRQDARLLVRTVARRTAGQSPWPHSRRVRLNRTSLFQQYWREYIGRDFGGGHVPDDFVLNFARLLSASFRDFYAEISRRGLAVDEAAARGVTPAAAPTLVGRFRRERNLLSDAAVQAWCQRRALSWPELLQTLRERDLEDRLRTRAHTAPRPARGARGWRIANAVAARTGMPMRVLTRPLMIYPGVPWLDILTRELKFRGRFTRALGIASRILRHNDDVFHRHPWLAGAPVRRGLLIGLLARQWRVATDQVEREMRARGFTGYDDCVEAARHLFVYERTSRGSYSPERLTDCFHVEYEADRELRSPARQVAAKGSTGTHELRVSVIGRADQHVGVEVPVSPSTSAIVGRRNGHGKRRNRSDPRTAGGQPCQQDAAREHGDDPTVLRPSLESPEDRRDRQSYGAELHNPSRRAGSQREGRAEEPR